MPVVHRSDAEVRRPVVTQAFIGNDGLAHEMRPGSERRTSWCGWWVDCYYSAGKPHAPKFPTCLRCIARMEHGPW